MSAVAVTDAELNAYADRQLDRSRVAAVELALAHDWTAAAVVSDIRRQNALLRDALDPWLMEPVTARLAAATSCVQPLRWRQHLVPLLANVATLALGMALGWLARDLTLEREGAPASFARQASLPHGLYASDANRPVEVWAAEENVSPRGCRAGLASRSTRPI